MPSTVAQCGRERRHAARRRATNVYLRLSSLKWQGKQLTRLFSSRTERNSTTASAIDALKQPISLGDKSFMFPNACPFSHFPTSSLPPSFIRAAPIERNSVSTRRRHHLSSCFPSFGSVI